MSQVSLDGLDDYRLRAKVYNGVEKYTRHYFSLVISFSCYIYVYIYRLKKQSWNYADSF